MTSLHIQHGPTKPFLKWPGGKRWLVPYVRKLLRGKRFKRYFEPFLGGGALFFGLELSNVTLSDINVDLVNTYLQVIRKPHELVRRIQEIPVNEETYLMVRLDSPQYKIDRAVRFLYLNRTAFGGIYRLNHKGVFNVPFGGGDRTPDCLWKDQLIVNASKALKEVTIVSKDFESLLIDAGKGDLIYCDPTYTVSHNNNGFLRYNERNFSWNDQQRLAKVCWEINKSGATVLVSNASHREIKKLYPTAEVHILKRTTRLCPDIKKRRPTQEYLFVLWPSK